MPDLDLDALEALLKRATAAPWKWIVNRQHKAACLMNERHQYVVDFARWGTGGARPRFRCTTGADLMVNADEFAQDIPGREHHSAWHQAIRHPDADLIVALRNAAPALIAAARERDELRERAEKAEARTMPTSREQVVTFLHAVAGHDATLSPPTDEMIDGVWALCKHPATTPLTLAVVAYERGRNFAAMKASAEKAERERDEATARAERAEAELRDARAAKGGA